MSESNPFASPRADAPAPSTTPLHTNGAVMLAAFLGSFLGAAWLIADNEHALGGSRTRPFVTGIAATTGLAVLVFVLPEQIPSSVFWAATVFGSRGWMEAEQGERVKAQLGKGTPRHSYWRAAGQGALMFVPAALLIVIVGAMAVTLTELRAPR